MRLRTHAGALQRRFKHGRNAATNRGPERPDGPTTWLQGKTTLARKAASGWKRQFNNPIPLPRGGRLVTLEDAGNYITKLPKAPKINLSFQLTPLECGGTSPAHREPRTCNDSRARPGRSRQRQS